MKLQKYITFALFLVCCLPFIVCAAGIHDDDLTHGFLDSPLPPEIMQYKGIVDGIDEESEHITINDTLYSFTSEPLLLTPGKSPTTLKYFTDGTAVTFFSKVKQKVIYEIMATESSKKDGTKSKNPTKNSKDFIFDNGTWHN